MRSWEGIEGLSSEMRSVEVCDFGILTEAGSVTGKDKIRFVEILKAHRGMVKKGAGRGPKELISIAY